MTFRDRIALGIIASALTIAAFMPGCDPISREETCARHIGIVFSVDDGATEELDAFRDCVMGRQ